MKFDKLIHFVGNMSLFDLPLIVQLSGESKRQITVQLHQWVNKGKVKALRRGFYTLADPYRRVRLSALEIANKIYRPSALSGIWALGYYGLIPEKVNLITSVTTRVTRSFENSWGCFSFFHLKNDFFWGYKTLETDGVAVCLAEPEKALLDYFHLTTGEWNEERIREMRFQNLEVVDTNKLLSFAETWDSPRLIRTSHRFCEMMTHNLNEDFKIL